jgi:hypothetical protein
MHKAELYEAALELPESVKSMKEGERFFWTVTDKQAIPAVIACVEKWELKDFPEQPTVETFPWSPRKDSHELIDWLMGEIRKIYQGELEIPNE